MPETETNLKFEHASVLLDETLAGLQIKPDGVYTDGTLGGAGHAYEVCKRLSKEGKFFGFDQDADAIIKASGRLREFEGQASIVRSNYVNMCNILKDKGIEQVDGILLDLGVSSYQLDTPKRGFSYKENSPLDMRMDDRISMTARDIVNQYSENELFRVIRDYGEDKFARNIAKHIVRMRQIKELETTFDLTEAIKAAIPMKLRFAGGHPAKKTFQAIRIELNRELEVLSESLDQMIDMLAPGGRLCIITFHSLEDRLVKNAFRRNENPCTCPPAFPICICGKHSKGINITKKPVLPSEEEKKRNTRSKSAKLRIFEKV